MKLTLSASHPLFRTSLRFADMHDRNLTIDCGPLTFVSPLEIVGIAALAHSAVKQGRSVDLHLPTDPDVASYLQRMDLMKHLKGAASIHGVAGVEERKDRSSILLELTAISTSEEAEDLAGRIVPLARKQATSEVTNAVFMGLGEFLDNACSHAKSPIGIFAAAQAYTGKTSGRRGLELAVADGGIGILDHLQGNARYSRFRRSVTAVRYALRPGVSGTQDRRGYGFSDVLDDVRRAGKGRLLVRSGDGVGRVTVQQDREKRVFDEAPIGISGTWVWLRVRIP